MFGNAPKALWTRWTQADEHNRIPLACRTLLIQEENRNILLETGIGLFFEPKLKERFGVVENEHRLLTELGAQGLSHEDIDVVVLSHMHFDHAGGLLSEWKEGEVPKLLFPNAQFAIGTQAWERAQNPHPRDRASFVPVLNEQIQSSGRLHLIDSDTSDLLGPDYRFHLSDGHTPGLLLTEVPTQHGPLVFAADLIPGAPWVHLPITMGYDRFPEQLIDEKRELLEDLEARNGWLLFTHDPTVACGQVQRDSRGRFGLSTTYTQWRVACRLVESPSKPLSLKRLLNSLSEVRYLSQSDFFFCSARRPRRGLEPMVRRVHTGANWILDSPEVGTGSKHGTECGTSLSRSLGGASWCASVNASENPSALLTEGFKQRRSRRLVCTGSDEIRYAPTPRRPAASIRPVLRASLGVDSIQTHSDRRGSALESSVVLPMAEFILDSQAAGTTHSRFI